MPRALGATSAIVDALDAERLRRAVAAAKPRHVVHQLTALPKGGPKNTRDLMSTNRLRIEGTRHLVDAAIAAGAKRIVGGSFALIGAAKAAVPDDTQDAAGAVASMESQILDANRSGVIEGVVLRYGLFYGPKVASTIEMVALARRRMLPAIRGDRSLLPYIHVDDAASATVAALDRAPAGSTFDIVDDQAISFSEVVRTISAAAGAPPPIALPAWLLRLASPFRARMLSLRLPLSNQKARAELGWRPEYSSIHDGLSRPRGGSRRGRYVTSDGPSLLT